MQGALDVYLPQRIVIARPTGWGGRICGVRRRSRARCVESVMAAGWWWIAGCGWALGGGRRGFHSRPRRRKSGRGAIAADLVIGGMDRDRQRCASFGSDRCWPVYWVTEPLPRWLSNRDGGGVSRSVLEQWVPRRWSWLWRIQLRPKWRNSGGDCLMEPVVTPAVVIASDRDGRQGVSVAGGSGWLWFVVGDLVFGTDSA